MGLMAWLLAGAIAGGEYPTTARAGESWAELADRFAVQARLLPLWNWGIQAPFQGGERLLVSDVHVVPRFKGTAIVINTAESRLYLFRGGWPDLDVPCGVGHPTWPTPLGRFRVQTKADHPTWRPPASIQREMNVPAVVPPGPDNPLGRHWLGFAGAVGIHGAPHWQMPANSHGCVRLRPQDARRLYDRVSVGMPVLVVHQPIKVGMSAGLVYAEVHPGRPQPGEPALMARLAGRKLDPVRVKRALTERLGLPVRVSP